MPINFICNDPLAASGAPAMRSQSPRSDRPSERAGFSFSGAAAEGLYSLGTPEFLFWQCREAALSAVETWESFAGNLISWSPDAANTKKLPVRQNAGNNLNAFYDRESFSFFEYTTPPKTTFSGSSTDVVAHEVGHGLLDSIRPELFNSFYTEAGALHEAFGDCMAFLTAIADRRTREALLAVTSDLGSGNFVEATAEDLSDGVRRALGSQHNASAPRHLLNSFKFQIPSTLPTDGPPTQLINEIHSFGQVFTGCFYDCVRGVFNSANSHSGGYQRGNRPPGIRRLHPSYDCGNAERMSL